MTDFRALCAELVDELHYQSSDHRSDELITRARAALAEQPKTEQPPKNCWLDDEPDLCPTPCVFDDSSDAIYNCCFAIKLNAEGKPKETCKYYRAARRPQPPSLKEQALIALWQVGSCEGIDNDTFETLRRALEALPND